MFSGMKLTKRQKLEALAIEPVPHPFGEKLAIVRKITEEMRLEAGKLGIHRKFTPDGRFLGDIGEVIGKLHFGVKLHRTQTEGEDGTCEISGRCVEVKLRSNSALIWVKKVPDFLVAIYLSPGKLLWGTVCNGPGELLLRGAKWNEQHKRYETDLSKLLALAEEQRAKDIKGLSRI